MTGGGGFSSRRLTRVRDLLERHVDSGYVPGVVGVIARHGEVHITAVGTLAFDGPDASTPMAADTIWRTGSMTKPLVAACAMTLVEDGTLRLDDPVDALLPELADMTVLTDPSGPLENTVPAKRPITLRDLLTYRLGTGMVFGDPGTVPIVDALAPLGALVYPEEPSDAVPGARPAAMPAPPPGAESAPDEWLRRLGALPLVHQPGELWMYETAAHLTVILVARATGMPFSDALRERICAPLGMADTGFSVEASDLNRVATAYRHGEPGTPILIDDAPDGYWSRPPAFESGGGGIVTTASDYLAFASTLLAGGTHDGERVLSRPAVSLMTTDHLTPEQHLVSGFPAGYFAEFGWGFGMSVRTQRTQLGPSVGSYGWPGYYGTTWYNDPAEDMTMIFMHQRGPADQTAPIRQDFTTAAYQAIDD